jgi:CRP-like cAMP-binding protein
MKSYVDSKHSLICKKSQQFIIEGTPIQGLNFIQKGKVKTVKTIINGREQIVRLTKDGNTVGFRGFGTGKCYPIFVYAPEETVLCDFINSDIIEILHNIPEFIFNLMLFYAVELYKCENNIRKINQINVSERLIDTLLYIDRKFRQSNDIIEIAFSEKKLPILLELLISK